MPTGKIKLNVDHESVSNLSNDHPNREFPLYDYKRTEKGFSAVLGVSELLPETVLSYFEKDTAVTGYEVFHPEESSSSVRFSVQGPQAYPYRAIFTMTDSHSLVSVQAGWIYGTITGSRDTLRTFITKVQEDDISYQLLSIRESNTPSELLTSRQREVVQEALDQGYYKTPKECTLTDIADSLDSHKTTISGVLNRAEGRIISTFMNDNVSEIG